MAEQYPHKIIDKNGNIQIEMRPFMQTLEQEEKIEVRARTIRREIRNKTDREDRESAERLKLCRGCDDLCKVIQTRRFRGDSVTPYDRPKKVLHWWCRSYGLHLEFIDRIIGGGRSEDGCGKECNRFRN